MPQKSRAEYLLCSAFKDFGRKSATLDSQSLNSDTNSQGHTHGSYLLARIGSALKFYFYIVMVTHKVCQFACRKKMWHLIV